MSEPHIIDIKIDQNKIFKDRFEFGKYIHNILKNKIKNDPTLMNDENLWTWLTILYIDQFAKNAKGKIVLSSEIEVYVLDFSAGNNHERSYRHIAHICFKAYETFGDKMKFMCGPNPTIYGKTGGEFWEQTTASPLLFEHRNLFNLCHSLYTDPITGYAKKNFASKYEETNGVFKINSRGPLKGHYSGTASIRRFIEVLRYIQKKFRYKKMSTKDIKNTLPSEFGVL